MARRRKGRSIVCRKPWRERLRGGKARGRRPADFDPRQLQIGTRVEMEHTDDPCLAQEIAMDHLTESRNYYVRLLRHHLDGASRRQRR
jgi:hypothetical protein